MHSKWQGGCPIQQCHGPLVSALLRCWKHQWQNRQPCSLALQSVKSANLSEVPEIPLCTWSIAASFKHLQLYYCCISREMNAMPSFRSIFNLCFNQTESRNRDNASLIVVQSIPSILHVHLVLRQGLEGQNIFFRSIQLSFSTLFKYTGIIADLRLYGCESSESDSPQDLTCIWVARTSRGKKWAFPSSDSSETWISGRYLLHPPYDPLLYILSNCRSS